MSLQLDMGYTLCYNVIVVGEHAKQRRRGGSEAGVMPSPFGAAFRLTAVNVDLDAPRASPSATIKAAP